MFHRKLNSGDSESMNMTRVKMGPFCSVFLTENVSQVDDESFLEATVTYFTRILSHRRPSLLRDLERDWAERVPCLLQRYCWFEMFGSPMETAKYRYSQFACRE
jgi:hypothetical protein